MLRRVACSARACRPLLCLSLFCLPFAGCETPRPNEKPVFPVTGVVTVDGLPQDGIRVTLHDENGLDVAQPTFPTGFTDADGKVAISTYAAGDGAPPGRYRLTFMWGQVNPMSMSYSGPDKLGGRYSDMEQSEIEVEVREEGANDLGVVELSTTPRPTAKQ